jgi:hypothetical protein
LQVEQLAAPSAGIGGDVEEREQPMLSRCFQECPELGDGPYSSRLVELRRGRLALSTGLLAMRSSTITASRKALRRTACRCVTVGTASGLPSRPPHSNLGDQEHF